MKKRHVLNSKYHEELTLLVRAAQRRFGVTLLLLPAKDFWLVSVVPSPAHEGLICLTAEATGYPFWLTLYQYDGKFSCCVNNLPEALMVLGKFIEEIRSPQGRRTDVPAKK